MIVLITPTGARPDQINLCYEYMMNQDYTGPVTWLVIDDCEPNTTNQFPSFPKENWRLIKLSPDYKWKPGDNTQGANIKFALDYVRQNLINLTTGIFIIEDDDYYSPGYLTEMVQRLKGYDLAGELCTIYYSVKYRGWFRNMNRFHSSLFQIAFSPSAIDHLYASLDNKYIDIYFCKAVQNKNLFIGNDIAIGIKGLPGRGGIGNGHGNLTSYKKDYDLEQLIKFIGKYAANYAKYSVHL